MTIVSKEYNPNLPVAYGGCNCRCHSDANTLHVAPCCYPGTFHERTEQDAIPPKTLLVE